MQCFFILHIISCCFLQISVIFQCAQRGVGFLHEMLDVRLPITEGEDGQVFELLKQGEILSKCGNPALLHNYFFFKGA